MKVVIGKEDKQKATVAAMDANGMDEPDCHYPVQLSKMKTKSHTSINMEDSGDGNEVFNKTKNDQASGKSQKDVSKLGSDVAKNCIQDKKGNKKLKHKLSESSIDTKDTLKKKKTKHRLVEQVIDDSNEFEDSDSGFHEVEVKHTVLSHNLQQSSIRVNKVDKQRKIKEDKTGKSVCDMQTELTKLKSKPETSAKMMLSSNTSSLTQGDYDFFKLHLDMIPPKFLADATIEDDDDDEPKHSRPQSLQSQSKWKKPDSKPQNKTAPQTSDTSSTDTYSKIKEKMKHKKNKKKDKKDSTKSSNSDDRRQMLREKLLDRIDELKGKRNLTTDEIIEKKRLRRKQSKLKSKMKKKEGNNKGNTAKPNSADDIPEKKPVVTPIKDKKSGKMVFSKFDFVDTGEKEVSQSKLKGKDYKRLLEKVEKKKEKIDKLKETNPYQAKTLFKKEAWKNVMMKAEGEKVKDDTNLLKKSLKKKEKMKEKRKKKWEERQSQTENRMKAQQDKRQKNIQARKQAKTDKKIKRAKKKGRMVPGF